MAENKLGIVAMGLVPLTIVGGAMAFMMLASPTAQATCNPQDATSVVVDMTTIPTGAVAGYSGVQLVNAAYILQAGADLGLGARDQTIAVMTAMGESSLLVLDHGDAAGPDSRGLFQQRDNGAWGTYADRMDPYTSATNFLTALAGIAERDTLEPTIVAHRVQHNADPYHYAQYWDPALAVVQALGGTSTGLVAGNGAHPCTAVPGVAGQVNPAGWAQPAAGPITSSYGMRYHPIEHVWRLHAGVDLDGGDCGGPIWAANDGTVTFAGASAGYGNMIEIDHGGGVRTRYGHMYANGVLVRVGDHVQGGDNIALIGDTGLSTACHLHFEVYLNGQTTDPVPYLATVGITLK